MAPKKAPVKAVATASPMRAASPAPAPTGNFKMTPERDTWNGTYEFGGWIGNLIIMAYSHVILLYFFTCVDGFGGQALYPGHEALQGKDFLPTVLDYLWNHAAPTWGTFGGYLAFIAYEIVLAIILPGPISQGKPIPSENGYRHSYRCNAVYAWYCVLITAGILNYTEILRLSDISKNWGHYMSAAIIVADLTSIAVFVWGFVAKRTLRMSGNPIYDFFMGSCLNPKLPGGVDMKLFAELRNSWVLLFTLTLSCAVRMYEENGAVTSSMGILLLAHFLYTNACNKGEECVPTSWDIAYEKFGWMLIFWNFAGVPFLYSMQAQYLVNVRPTFEYPPVVAVIMVAVLLCAYYVFDTVNGQKNRFRMMRDGAPDYIIRRKTFPAFKYGLIENPRTLKSERGELFIDGWYQYARKAHYSADIVMASIWCLVCGFEHFAVPYFYILFFVPMLLHRLIRDEERGQEKYGELWDRYLKAVPYRLIPYVW